MSGSLAGLLAGMIWGIIQEKKFIFRNMNKELHLREHPIQLFSVMMRGTKTMAIVGTFFGVTTGLQFLQIFEPSTAALVPKEGRFLQECYVGFAAICAIMCWTGTAPFCQGQQELQ